MQWWADSAGSGELTELHGRSGECATLDGLLEVVRDGRSAALVVRGDAGVGKTALLRYAEQAAADFRVARAAGVESESEIAFAALHRLCGPLLDRRDHLPGPQRDALDVAFGLMGGTEPDRLLVGLAVLSLLSEIAAQCPLLCVIDDAQWLDGVSAQVLAFVARRLLAESVLMVFAVREPDPDFRGLPELTVGRLRDADVQLVLAQVMPWPLDDQVREQILAETQGNPLALLELSRGMSPGELAGGFGLPHAPALAGRMEDGFLRRIEGLPEPVRMLLLVSAAEPTGNLSVVSRAAAQLGLNIDVATDAEATGLADFGARVRFRHPLVRSAVYRAASAAERQLAHHTLAEAIDPQVDPDRRAWHRAQAAVGPDEDIAAELEQSASRAQARGGVAATAAFLERAAALTVDPARRAHRAVAAAQAKHLTGAPDAAAGLLIRAEAGPADALLQARVSLLRGQMAFASGRSTEAPSLLLATARQFEQVAAPRLAREAYLDALAAAMLAGRVTGLAEVAAAVRQAPAAPKPPRIPDLLLDGLAMVINDDYAVGAAALQHAVRACRGGGLSAEDAIHWSFVACHSAHDLWDDEGWHELSSRNLQLARDVGALGLLPMALSQRIALELHAGEFAAAAALVEEIERITKATGNDLPPYGALALTSWQGRAEDAIELIDTTMKRAAVRGEGMGLSLTQYSSAVLNNGLGRYEDALAAAERASAYPAELGFANFALPEVVEAAARIGETKRANDALNQLTQTTGPCATPWARGVEARCRALLCEDSEAEPFYQEAINELSRCRGVVILARTRLLYGEWLRRVNRRIDARAQLKAAHETLVTAGAEAFAERARRELAATGETVRRRVVSTRELTAQERQIGRRARDGRTNAEIGAELFLSPRTVEWHLHKIFTKLGINSRRALHNALPEISDIALPA